MRAGTCNDAGDIAVFADVTRRDDSLRRERISPLATRITGQMTINHVVRLDVAPIATMMICFHEGLDSTLIQRINFLMIGIMFAM
jgi:hypothetical protein